MVSLWGFGDLGKIGDLNVGSGRLGRYFGVLKKHGI